MEYSHFSLIIKWHLRQDNRASRAEQSQGCRFDQGCSTYHGGQQALSSLADETGLHVNLKKHSTCVTTLRRAFEGGWFENRLRAIPFTFDISQACTFSIKNEIEMEIEVEHRFAVEGKTEGVY